MIIGNKRAWLTTQFNFLLSMHVISKSEEWFYDFRNYHCHTINLHDIYVTGNFSPEYPLGWTINYQVQNIKSGSMFCTDKIHSGTGIGKFFVKFAPTPYFRNRRSMKDSGPVF